MTQTVYGSVTHKASYFSYFFIISSVASAEGNYSDVTVSHYWQTSHTGYSFDTYSARPASITIEEETFNISKRFDVGAKWANGNPYLIQTETKRIYHDPDGKKQITVVTRANGKASTYGPSASTAAEDDCTAKAVIMLEDIPRASTFAVTQNVVCDGESAVTITAKKAADEIFHSAMITVMGKSWKSELFSDSISFIPPKEWNSVILSASATATVELTTYANSLGTEALGSTLGTFTIHVPDTAEFYPSITSFEVTPINETAPVASWGICLQSYTRFRFSVIAETSYGAAISRYHYAGFGSGIVSREASILSSVVQQPGSGTFLVKVTDSRGRTAIAESTEFTILPYTAPVISNPVVYRCNNDGTPSSKGVAAYLSAVGGFASCNGNNTIDLRCYYRAPGTPSYSNTSYFSLQSGIGQVCGAGMFDASKDYLFKFTATDAMGSTTESTEFLIEAADVLLNATDNEHLAFFGFADGCPEGATFFKKAHFPAGTSGVIDIEKAVVYAKLSNINIPISFQRTGNTTVMTFGVLLSEPPEDTTLGIQVPIPSGFIPSAECVTKENTTAALWGRGYYTPDIVGGLSLYPDSIRIYADLSIVSTGWTLGASMEWINEHDEE